MVTRRHRSLLYRIQLCDLACTSPAHWHLSHDRGHTLRLAAHRDGYCLAVRVRDQEFVCGCGDSRYVLSASLAYGVGVKGTIHYVLLAVL